MKTIERQIQVESNTTGEKIAMGIRVEDMAHVMNVLTDLYEDRELAMVREYSTNARDSHIEAGIADRPIEVTLPTPLTPFLRIKDYGLGMDRDQVREVYSQYGASSKRESNDVQGMLGLGGKSALTYTNQFNVTAVKDGKKIEVMVSRQENGGGEMEVVDEYETDEPNSVEVSVQAENNSFHRFEAKAKDFFKFWAEGTVLVNGEQPERVDGFWITDDLLIVDDQREDAIVMGNVAYPLPDEYQDYRRNYSIIAFVPIGSVHFTPSRESLMLDKTTKETIEATMERVEVEAGKAITKQLAEAPNKPAAVTLFTKLSALFERTFKVEAQYKGADIPASMEAPADQQFVTVTATSHKGYRSKGWNRMKSYPSSLWHKTIFIRGYDGGDFSPYKRAKMDQWLQEKGIDEPETFVFTKIVPNHHWIDRSMIFPWQEIKDQKIVREQVQKRDGRVSGSYEGYVDGEYKREILAQDIDTSNPVMHTEKNWGHSAGDIPSGVEKYTLVRIGQNRVNKFKRDFPTATTVQEFIAGLAKDWLAGLTEDQKLHLHIQEEIDYQTADKIKGLTLDDPELTFAIQQISNRDSKLKSKFQEFNGYITLNVKWDNPLRRYPLLSEMRFYGTMGDKMKAHVTLYMNAAYAASQEEAS